jgi:hypothetical protein
MKTAHRIFEHIRSALIVIGRLFFALFLCFLLVVGIYSLAKRTWQFASEAPGSAGVATLSALIRLADEYPALVLLTLFSAYILARTRPRFWISTGD